MEIESVGVDLSKNHYGLCHIETNGKINFIYSYFKPYLKKLDKDRQEQFYQVIEREENNEHFSFKKIRYSYDDKKYNVIECDSLKSRINIKALTEYLENNVSHSKMVILEDYVSSGTKVMQLVHTAESFKYYLVNNGNKSGLILFICPVVTWRKFLWADIDLKTDDAYVKINLALEKFHKDVHTFMYSLGEPWDVTKEMIDSYSLANMKRHYGEMFKKQYNNRIYIF